MKSYGLDLTDSNLNGKAEAVEFGTTFPTNDLQVGTLFFIQNNPEGLPDGLYAYNGTDWLTSSVSTTVLIPGGSSPLPTAAPTTPLSPISVNAEGTANSFARSDHTHAVEGFQESGPDPVAMSLIFGS